MFEMQLLMNPHYIIMSYAVASMCMKQMLATYHNIKIRKTVKDKTCVPI